MAKKPSGGPTRSLESAISLPIVNGLETLSTENTQGFSTLASLAETTIKRLENLDSTFSKILSAQKEQLNYARLDLIKQQEMRDEASRSKDDSSGVAFGKGATGIGLGVIAAISGALIGLAQGFLESFKNTMNAIKTLVVGLKQWFVGTKFFDSIKLNITSFFTGISMKFDLAKAWFKESAIGKSLIQALDGWKAEFQLWKDGFKSITKYLKIEDALAGWKAELELWRPAITAVKNAFTFIKDGILGFGSSADEAKGIITATFDIIGGYLTKIKTFFGGWITKIGDWLKLLSGMDGIFSTIGKTIGKLFYPFTLIMALVDTVTGAMEGYEEGGIFGGIKGAITGFLSGLIAAPLDLLKDLISWLADSVGLDSFSEMLDSFSFADAFKKIINGIFDGILETLATIADFIPGLGGVAKNIRSLKTENAKAAAVVAAPAPAAAATAATPKVPKEITAEDRQTDAYQAILKAEPVRNPGDPRSERAAQFRADEKYKRMLGEQGGVEQTAPKSVAPRGAMVDKTSRQAASASSTPIVVAPSSTSVNAPTVNTNNSTTFMSPSPRRNSAPVNGGLMIDPILGV